MDVENECEPYFARSRRTVVGSCGAAIVPSSYPPFCGLQLSVSVTSSLLVTFVSTIVHQTSPGDLDRVDL